MEDRLTEILLEIFESDPRGERINPDEWVARFPEHEDEIRRYIARLQILGEAESASTEAVDITADSDRFRRITVGAIARARLRRIDREFGGRIERARGAGMRRPRGGDAAWFPKFSVFAWIVLLLNESNGYTKRFRAQKVAFLVEHALDLQLFVEHERFAAGRYDWRLRYEKTGEPYAKQLGWFEVEKGSKGDESDRYRVFPEGRAAAVHAARHLADPEVFRELVFHLAESSSDELERLVTVLDIALELQAHGKVVSTANIEDRLASDPDYEHKLDLDYFSESDIRDSLVRLRDLKILSGIPDPDDDE